MYASPIYLDEKMASAAGVRASRTLSKDKAGCINPSLLAKNLALAELCTTPLRLAKADLCALPRLSLLTYHEDLLTSTHNMTHKIEK